MSDRRVTRSMTAGSNNNEPNGNSTSNASNASGNNGSSVSNANGRIATNGRPRGRPNAAAAAATAAATTAAAATAPTQLSARHAAPNVITRSTSAATNPNAPTAPVRYTPVTAVRNIPGYPTRNVPLPAGLSDNDIFNNWKNHLYGDVLLDLHTRHSADQIANLIGHGTSLHAIYSRISRARQSARSYGTVTVARRQATNLYNADIYGFPDGHTILPPGLSIDQILDGYFNHVRGPLLLQILQHRSEAEIAHRVGRGMTPTTIQMRARDAQAEPPVPEALLYQFAPPQINPSSTGPSAYGAILANAAAQPTSSTPIGPLSSASNASRNVGGATWNSYPARNVPLPAGLSAEDIVVQYPNHLHGEVLMAVFQAIGLEEIVRLSPLGVKYHTLRVRLTRAGYVSSHPNSTRNARGQFARGESEVAEDQRTNETMQEEAQEEAPADISGEMPEGMDVDDFHLMTALTQFNNPQTQTYPPLPELPPVEAAEVDVLAELESRWFGEPMDLDDSEQLQETLFEDESQEPEYSEWLDMDQLEEHGLGSMVKEAKGKEFPCILTEQDAFVSSRRDEMDDLRRLLVGWLCEPETALV
ncbi:hypothetical protein L228DRAFT_262019 [Xylona heveae TC161]|uniref:Uncharacterized protein n=1 Tax=Xylona heveae (strain CBS 132557 / TC161) TaxID=1328760 RepID=A0A165G9H5_XYLHT|nr:hypothetical protein L228DRAFT_262019 [Xylona heveae TC161]KZF21905.1 hypothetical protein L228DRAFT_262019 [Xylona heveae TC161]